MNTKSITDLKINSKISALNLFHADMSCDKNIEHVVKFFSNDTQCPGIVLLDNNEFFGMISRNSLFESLSKPFAPEIYLRRPIRIYYEDMKISVPQVLNEDLTISEAAAFSLTRKINELNDPVVVKTKHNKFRLVDAHELLLAQSHIHSLTINSLEQANIEISSQKKQIEEINQHLTDSINYAKNIQDAALPDAAALQSLGDYFIIFRPKDIVSGDFYWTYKTGNEIIAAVVDCTGHGVPGAFMLMIGNILLNQIVINQGVHRPEQILQMLHEGVQSTLKQNQPERRSSDGMDAGICLILPDENKVVYAGAKRPLYYYQRGIIHETKPTHRSIGGKEKMTAPKFSSHEISIDESVTLYLSTDGFCDQNNNDRVRFGTKKFVELLGQIGSSPLVEQQQALIDALDVHQQSSGQRDDITVLAISVKH